MGLVFSSKPIFKSLVRPHVVIKNTWAISVHLHQEYVGDLDNDSSLVVRPFVDINNACSCIALVKDLVRTLATSNIITSRN